MDPWRIGEQIVVLRGAVFELGGAELGHQAIFAPLGTVLQQAVLAHPDLRREFAVLQEGAVADDARVVAIGDEAALPAGSVEGQRAACAGRQRGREPVDPVLQVGVIHHQRRTGNRDCAQPGLVVGQAYVKIAHRRAGIVDERIHAVRLQPTLIGIERDGQPDVGDRRLRHADIA